MTTHKKLLALAIAAVLIISCGCSSQKPNDAQSETNAPSNSTQEVTGENVITGKIAEVSSDMKTIKVQTASTEHIIEILADAEFSKESPPGFDPTQPAPPPPEGEEMPEQGSPEAIAEILTVGNMVNVTLNEDGKAIKVEMLFHQDANERNGNGVTTITSSEKISNKEYTSTGNDENALRIDGALVALDKVTVTKNGGTASSTDDGDFYGLNATSLSLGGALVDITNSTFTSSALCANGIFALGGDTKVTVKDTQIETKEDYSGGIMVTNNATIEAENLNIHTHGDHSAPIRTDKGGGTLVVNGGEYLSEGTDSPTIYAMGDVTIDGITGVSNNSEAIILEGDGNTKISNSTLSSCMANEGNNSSKINTQGIMIYHSATSHMSSSLELSDCNITNRNGDLFFITNIDTHIVLTNNTFVNETTNGVLIDVRGAGHKIGWGSVGSNGGRATIDCYKQALEGEINVDNISSLTLSLNEGSSLTGAIKTVTNEYSQALNYEIRVRIDESSTWTLTDDCVVTELENNGTINYNGYKIMLPDGTVIGQ